MLHTLAEAADLPTREVWWCYGARNGREHPFAKEVRDALIHLRSSHSVIAYSRPNKQDRIGIDFNAAGHLELSQLQEQGPPRTAGFYLCGPWTFISALSEELKSWNVPDGCIHSEAFGLGSSFTPGIAGVPTRAPHPPADIAASGFAVSFTPSGLTAHWNPQFRSLLEFAEACNVPVRWSCRSGVCQTCKTGVIAGTVKYDPQPLDQIGNDDMLICCATPTSEIELDL